MNLEPEFSTLPGAELVSRGLQDLRDGRESECSLLVMAAAPRLRALGIEIPADASQEPPEHRLYERVAANEGDGAHSRYNALIARMVSFARSAEHATAG